MLLNGGYEVPDRCPENCAFIGDVARFGQQSMCTRCPVLVCKDYEGIGALVLADDYRPDWAAEWVKFFNDGTVPSLQL